ncbi:beta-galactosidase [Streptomyces sp. NBC_00257]|uniref:glycoside hydrolase family 35 protein n=1 Tax=unclassified Streptomyces TaxID=2593676 RepID=UPI00224CB3DF|nr:MULTISPECIES: beta-galactosidase family protein [unclassified Streptomyces]WTB58506.1 beta-galactosidase [Streptomyces sp. NBC_00826]WTH88614.1 beta-galactosidase [Streptomyces sp. NBC_00825]WTH97344.1 beta-galactosidase [Streptomyces sp. NBC_00822]MCX4862853.1 beta-galactosidase [Streptomyces sp. NBC_00906]MCX4894090.1 beta-galactosidase [Streptomyces sp. NBC_00892]
MPHLQIDDGGFTLDGEPFRLLSGGLHYFRVHPEQWADRLRKARLMGLNTIETYVPWNLHQPRPGRFRLDGGLDLPRFIELAAAEGLHVLLRPGPYICAEWEGGGLPSWLLGEPGIQLRSRDPRFLDAVDDYFVRLFTPLQHCFASRGGPVLAVQVENEYGAYGDDTAYLEHLAGSLRSCGVDVPLFTCDQPADLERGALPGVLAAANFGSRSAQGLATLRAHQPKGPLMCAEFWIGWFDRWGTHHVVRDPDHAARELDELLATGASVNFYMFHGGTNFGFTNGANDKHTYRPTVTSYDYDAPLDEAGDPTPKYTAFRDVIAKYASVPDGPVPSPGPKLAPRTVALTGSAGLLASADALGTAVDARRPLTMEELEQDFGFVLYETKLPLKGPALLEVEQVRDRAQVFVDGQPVGVLERESHEHALSFVVPRAGSTLSVLVENQGRVNYGQGIHDRKGLLGKVLLDGAEPAEWASRPLPLTELSALGFEVAAAAPVGPTFHRGTFEVADPADAFLHLDGWTKGNAWVNGFALGRYWSRGPQRSLYVPAPVLRAGTNEIVVLELHAAHRGRTVQFRATADLGPTEE